MTDTLRQELSRRVGGRGPAVVTVCPSNWGCTLATVQVSTAQNVSVQPKSLQAQGPRSTTHAGCCLAKLPRGSTLQRAVGAIRSDATHQGHRRPPTSTSNHTRQHAAQQAPTAATVQPRPRALAKMRHRCAPQQLPTLCGQVLHPLLEARGLGGGLGGAHTCRPLLPQPPGRRGLHCGAAPAPVRAQRAGDAQATRPARPGTTMGGARVQLLQNGADARLLSGQLLHQLRQRHPGQRLLQPNGARHRRQRLQQAAGVQRLCRDCS